MVDRGYFNEEATLHFTMSVVLSLLLVQCSPAELCSIVYLLGKVFTMYNVMASSRGHIFYVMSWHLTSKYLKFVPYLKDERVRPCRPVVIKCGLNKQYLFLSQVVQLLYTVFV